MMKNVLTSTASFLFVILILANGTDAFQPAKRTTTRTTEAGKGSIVTTRQFPQQPFGQTPPLQQQQRRLLGEGKLVLSSSAPSDVEDVDYDDNGDEDDTPTEQQSNNAQIDNDDDALTATTREELKVELLRMCASYDRGFGASPKVRRTVQDLVDRLEALNPTPKGAARGMDGKSSIIDKTAPKPPLQGIWRMVWTTALDVLNLEASPVASQGAIYQVIEPPVATNIIDFIPRIQALFPASSFPPSLVRAEVQTRTSIRSNSSGSRDNYDDSNRVGLTFEGVKLVPIEILGVKSPDFLPSLQVDLPTKFINLEDLPGVNPDNLPGYFDVTYLDDDMLIIKQSAPGGYFVSIKVDNCFP